MYSTPLSHCFPVCLFFFLKTEMENSADEFFFPCQHGRSALSAYEYENSTGQMNADITVYVDSGLLSCQSCYLGK